MQNNYAKLKTKLLSFDKVAFPGYLEINIPTKHLIVNLLCPEVPESVETELNRSNLKPYELAVRSKGTADYLYDLSEIENAGTRQVFGTDLIAANTVITSGQCVVIVVYLEFQN